MTEEKKPKRYFTEVEMRAVESLEPTIRNKFMDRLATLTMRMRVAEDAWVKERDELDKDLDVLVEEIHEALAKR